MNKSITFLLLFIASSIFAQTNNEKAPITLADLSPYAYDFDINGKELEGKGAKILSEAMAKVQFTMLGVNSRSRLEAAFIEALVKELDKGNYKTMVTESGPASGDMIRKLAQDPTKVMEAFRTLNRKYAFDIKDLKIGPIPDVRTIEAGKYIQTAREHDWNIVAIGTEYWTGYRMFADEMFENLSGIDKKNHQTLYQKTIQHLDEQYEILNGQGYDDILNFITSIKSANLFPEFLEEMSKYPKNEKITEVLLFSLDYWEMYGNQEGYKKNKLNSKKNKTRIARELKDIQFDLSKDKLFIQMWKGHLVKGTTGNGFYGVGNTLNEIAELNGSASLCIGVIQRFSEVNGEVKDILESKGFSNNFYKELLPLGKKDEWVLIDLRPFNQKFHWGRYDLSPQLGKIINRFDMLVIPKTNGSATINW